MDEWRIQQQQQQHRMVSGGVGPILSYHSIRSRSSPYPSPHQMSELKQSYQYQQNSSTTSSNPLSPSAPTSNQNQSTPPLSVKNDSNDTTSSSSSSSDEVSTTTSNSDVYTPNNTNVPYTPIQMEQIQQQQQQQHQQRIMATKSSIGPMVGYHPGQQQMMTARSRSMPYPMPPPHHHQQQPQHPSMYPNPSGPVCQCAQHMHASNGHYPMHPSQHSMYYQQQQHEAWYRYHQQQAAWRQHQMQQQHLQSHPQPVPIEQSYNAILSDTTSTTKLKTTKTKTKKKLNNTPSLNEEPLLKYQPIPPSSLNLSVQQSRVCIPPTSTAYYPSVYSTPNPYVPAQQLPPPSLSTSIPQDHPMYTQTSPSTLSHYQSQIFTSPLSNPGTPHQIHNNGEFNGTAEFGVPYHHGAPGSVNSLTDALCPSGDTTDRQMTPGPPSVGTPRVPPHQYSFPHTPLTPQTINNQNTNPHTPVMMPPTPNPLSAPPTPLTRPRSSSEQIPNYFQQYEQNKSMNNVDDLAAYLKDPTNVYLTDDVSSTLFDDIDALADTYLGQQSNHQQQTNVDHNSAEDILLNFLCSDLTN
jgi:hypothetical protein